MIDKYIISKNNYIYNDNKYEKFEDIPFKKSFAICTDYNNINKKNYIVLLDISSFNIFGIYLKMNYNK